MSDLPCARVLIVDDEPDTAAMVALLLEEEGHTCTTARTGSEAIMLCRTQRFDCMLLDVRLQHMSGMVIAERLADTQFRPRHIVLMTGAKLADLESALRNGLVDGYLQKPADISQLIERVKASLSPRDGRHLRQNPA
jgi:DNA-binding response OmpR family regulator